MASSSTLPDMVVALHGHHLFALAHAQLLPMASALQMTLSVPMPIGMTDQWIRRVATAHGWLVEDRGCGQYGLEPEDPPETNVGERLFHVTPAGKAPSVTQNGLIPQTGGQTWMGRSYPPRIYLATSLLDAFVFLDSKASQGSSVAGPGILSQNDLCDWEIFTTLATQSMYPLDPWMSNAVWVAAPIAASAVSIVADWRAKYLTVAAWR